MDNSQKDDHILPSPKSNQTGSQSTGSFVDDSTKTQQSSSAVNSKDYSEQPYTPLSTELPLSAEDIDLIEKEWVTKAKAIVSSTMGNPRRQSQELSNVKSQYIAKRFNKELPTNE